MFETFPKHFTIFYDPGGEYGDKKYNQNEHYKGKASKQWLADLKCTGTESNLNVCPGIRWGSVPWGDCSRSHDVGVKCFL